MSPVRTERDIPKLQGLPLLGNLLELRRDRLAVLERVLAECGDVGAFRVGPRPVYVFNRPADAAEILHGKADAFERGPMMRRFARPVFGTGMVTAPPASHARKRRLVAPALQRIPAEHHVACAIRAARATEAGWTDGQRIDIHAEMTRLMLGTIGRTLLGLEEERDALALGEAMECVLRAASERLDHPLALPQPWPSKTNLKVRRAAGELDRAVRELLRSRRETPRDDLLSHLVRIEQAGDRLSEDELRDEVMLLFVAGYETLASALGWTWSLLARSQPELERLRAEVEGAIGGRELTALDAGRLPLTTQVMKEGLRLYPPLHTLGRQAARDVEIGGFLLRRSAIVIVSPYLLHRRPELFPRPLEFDPGRFSPERAALIPEHAYLPFGLGPRACLGAQVALGQGTAILATIARRVRLVDGGREFPKPETLMSLRPREAWLEVRRA